MHAIPSPVVLLLAGRVAVVTIARDEGVLLDGAGSNSVAAGRLDAAGWLDTASLTR